MQGYEMFAEYLGQKQRGGLNCNHGAPHSGIGGWQAVNLSPKDWLQVWKRWKALDYKHNIPFFWCGKPNLLNERLVVRVHYQPKDSMWFVDHGEYFPELTVHKLVDDLNAVLHDVGLRPVDLDVPDNADWSSYYPTN